MNMGIAKETENMAYSDRKVLDHDLDEIAEEFLKFAKGQGFDFWE